MGVLRFRAPDSSRLPEDFVQRAYVTGTDPFPWATRVRLHGGELTAERSTSDSARFHIPWNVPGRGELTLATTTLMERERPYPLLIELARGEIHRLRQQTAEWIGMGLVLSQKAVSATAEAIRRFSRAATRQHLENGSNALAEDAIVAALDAADALVECFVEQAIAVRRRMLPKLETRWGINLGPTKLARASATQILKGFNSVVVPTVWRDVEAVEGAYSWDAFDKQVKWAQEQSLFVCGGPLLRLDSEGAPDWLYLWEGDFDNILSFVSDYVETTVSRFRGKVNLWQCASRIASSNILGMREIQQMRLAVRAVEITRNIDPGAPTIITVNQPWAEHLRTGERDFSPLRLIDELLRTGLKLDGLGLEINAGYLPGGSYLRSRMAYSRLLDVWTALGLPLYVFLTVPSDETPDPLARSKSSPAEKGLAEGWTPAAQRRWLREYLALLLAKPVVHGVFYNQWHDSAPHEFPHSGLVDGKGIVKPGFKSFVELRREHLK